MKYTITLHKTEEFFGTIEVEAADENAATQRAEEIIDKLNKDDGEPPPGIEWEAENIVIDLDAIEEE